ncbi:helix-turn-helix domain-containing protein [Naasia lichenicola]|uniref:Cupin domain-containing protein n=1 Tax=Naasia lichenicola TaxID=2565933 RepID=A0A4V6RZ37_9MICO|nr:cupin domain-containing protein [Naasia lichenicola]THG33347.1 cupin domain-containing protein [Naasia lichenicola]
MVDELFDAAAVIDREMRSIVGERLRSAREASRMSTRDVAARAGLSAGFISQVETGRSGVSVASLKRISSALGISAADLLADDPPASRQVLRAHERPVFSGEDGVTKLLLSRMPIRQLEVYDATIEVGGSTGDEPYSHDNAQEIFYVLEGHVEVTVGGERHALGPRDSLEYLSTTPHRAVNVGTVTASVMWISSHLTPPAEPYL